MAMMRDDKGSHSTATKRDAYTEKRAREARPGGAYDAGPGREGLPMARDMDRPRSPCGTFDRTGNSRGGIDGGIRKIQD
jgi:hypothetical protein